MKHAGFASCLRTVLLLLLLLGHGRSTGRGRGREGVLAVEAFWVEWSGLIRAASILLILLWFCLCLMPLLPLLCL